MTQTTWHADPLVWGHGPRVFEAFLEPTCPFSVRAFGKLDDLLAQAGEDRITIKIRLQSQPWHMYSGRDRALHPGGLHAAGRQGKRRSPSWRRSPRIARNSSSSAIAAAPIWTPRRTTSSPGSKNYSGVKSRRGFRNPRPRPRGQMALQIRAPERHPCVADLHDRRPSGTRHGQRRRCVRLGVAPCQKLNPQPSDHEISLCPPRCATILPNGRMQC